MSVGLFITVEGIEGVGKSTAIRYISDYFKQKNRDVILTREPGGTEIAEKIRQLVLDHSQEVLVPAAELMLFFAARAQHVAHLIQPSLAQGKIVLCDRFTDSSYAYQMAGRSISESYLTVLENLAHKNLQPNLTLLLDASPEIGLARAKKDKELDRIEVEKIEFFNAVRKAYLARAEQYSHRFRIINAEKTPEQVLVDIKTILNEFC